MHDSPTPCPPITPGKSPIRLHWQRAACVLLEATPQGWSGLYCFQAHETPAATAAYLNSHYPDGLSRLRPLGDLITLGSAPSECERMDEDGDYEPARDPDYPPPAWEHWDDLMDMWTAVHVVLHFVVRWRADLGWEAVSIGGRPLSV